MSADESRSPSHPPFWAPGRWIAAAESDGAFRISLVGLSMFALGAIVISVILARTFKDTTVTVYIVVYLLFYLSNVGMLLWNNYCLVYGHCHGLAYYYGVLYLVVGIAAVVVALVMTFKSDMIAPMLSKMLSKNPDALSASAK